MKQSLPAVISIACGLLLAACAGGGSITESTPGVVRAAGVTPQAASQSVVAGKSKADVAAAMGKAAVVHFDSGHEVWVYRWPGADRTSRTATELVVLFDPSGVVKKSRIRPGYPPERK